MPVATLLSFVGARTQRTTPKLMNAEVKKHSLNSDQEWTAFQKIAFRIFSVFFILICIPNSIGWYKQVVQIDWTSLHYRDLYDIARFGSGINFFGNSIFGSTLLGYANWIITLLIATGIGLIWTWIAKLRNKERREYNTLYYWVRAVVRYRAAIGIIGFGFTKVLPVQMPYPSLGLLNTDFGDFTAQKIYWLSIAIVPWYQVFAGVVELAAGVLLLFRKTTTPGAVLLFGALGDIVYVNFAYDGGVHVYSSYFVLLAAFLMVHELPKLYDLLIREKAAVPYRFVPELPGWLNGFRITTKLAVFVVFIGLFFYLQLLNFWYDPYKQPAVKGVVDLRGNYSVDEFWINNQLIPPAPADSVRWQQVTFENWSTLTFKVNHPTSLDLSNGGGDPQRDLNRTFEITGTAGGQRAFHYEADEKEKILYLTDKYKDIPEPRNRAAGVGVASLWKPEDWIDSAARANIGNELYKIDQRALSTRRVREYQNAPAFEPRKRMKLQYEVDAASGSVILSGLNETKDAIRVVLRKVERPYVLEEPSLKAGNY